MKFHLDTAEIYIPDGVSVDEALARTTHLCIAAHQDDIEIMAAQPIIECFQQDDKWFTGVVVTNGRGSPRNGIYEKYSDDEMRDVRFKEQRKAAFVGEFSAQIMLDFPSKIVKDGSQSVVVDDILAILQATKPEKVYTHNIADKHTTHIGVVMRTLRALRKLDAASQPSKVYGCEVWRNLDWMRDAEKVVMDNSAQKNLQAALLGVFDSQISGGKRYDLAAMGRRIANATFFESHDVDESSDLSYAMDLTPLMKNPDLKITEYVKGFIDRFYQDVETLIEEVA